MAVYNEVYELPEKMEERLGNMLVDDEQFIVAVGTWGGILGSYAYHHIVTNRRLISASYLTGSEQRTDINMADISGIDYNPNAGLLGKLEITAPGVNKQYKFRAKEGKIVADEIRTQLAEQSNL